MKKLSAILLLLFTTLCAGAQTISGLVLDEKGAPIPGATIFITNSKYITAADKKGEFAFYGIKPGGYEVVVRSIGFLPHVQSVMVQNEALKLTVRLKESNDQLKAVTIDGSGNRERYMKIFVRNFIGETTNAKQCTIVNPQVIHFSYNKKSASLKVKADDLIIVENRALGYRLKYLLREFEVFTKTFTCVNIGSPYFEELQGTADEQKQWDLNRRKAYLGSARHFIRSVMSNATWTEGFICYRIPEHISQEDFAAAPVEKNIDSLFVADAGKSFKVMHCPLVQIGSISTRLALYVVYVGPKVAERVYKSGTRGFDTRRDEPSMLVPQVDAIRIDRNGGISPSKSAVVTGYWSKMRIANLTPIEYSAVASPQTDADADSHFTVKKEVGIQDIHVIE